MRLVRLGEKGDERPGVLVADDRYVDVSDVVGDYNEAFFESGAIDDLRALVRLRESRGETETVDGLRVGAPIARPHQIICIGLNYRDHALETGQAIPTEPIVFNKAPGTLVGPNDAVIVPKGSAKTDWEVELGIVVGRRASYLENEASAADHIAGYVLVNDVSERAWQLERGGQWVKGKSAPTFNPAGPALVTPEELVDPANLTMWLDVNGVRRQSGSTATMLFGPTFLVHYLSQFMTLEPGDLINTGTPPGVGMSMAPPTFLKPGDVMELGIEGLGIQRQHVRAFSGSAVD